MVSQLLCSSVCPFANVTILVDFLCFLLWPHVLTVCTQLSTPFLSNTFVTEAWVSFVYGKSLARALISGCMKFFCALWLQSFLAALLLNLETELAVAVQYSGHARSNNWPVFCNFDALGGPNMDVSLPKLCRQTLLHGHSSPRALCTTWSNFVWTCILV